MSTAIFAFEKLLENFASVSELQLLSHTLHLGLHQKQVIYSTAVRPLLRVELLVKMDGKVIDIFCQRITKYIGLQAKKNAKKSRSSFICFSVLG